MFYRNLHQSQTFVTNKLKVYKEKHNLKERIEYLRHANLT